MRLRKHLIDATGTTLAKDHRQGLPRTAHDAVVQSLLVTSSASHSLSSSGPSPLGTQQGGATNLQGIRAEVTKTQDGREASAVRWEMLKSCKRSR